MPTLLVSPPWAAQVISSWSETCLMAVLTDFLLCHLGILRLKRTQGQTGKESSACFWGHRQQPPLTSFHTQELYLGRSGKSQPPSPSQLQALNLNSTLPPRSPAQTCTLRSLNTSPPYETHFPGPR